MVVSTLSDLKRQFLLDNTGLPSLKNTNLDLEFAYYSALSGLTPILKYTVADHKRAYLETQTGLSKKTMAFLERTFWLNEGIQSNTMQSMAYDFYRLSNTPYWTGSSNKLELALDASSIVSTDGSPIAQWNDLSGKGRHVIQALAAKQPMYRNNAINSPPVTLSNNMPTVQFDGVDDVIDTLPVTTFPNSTVYVVTRSDTPRITDRLIYHRGTNGTWMASNTTVISANGRIPDGSFPSISTPSNRANTNVQVMKITNGSPLLVSNNGVSAVGVTNYVHLAESTPIVIVSGAPLYCGCIAAVLIYSEAHNDVKRKRIEKWLGNKYGIGIAP